jgi:toxin ParE2
MTVIMLPGAEAELDDVFEFYEAARAGLGLQLITQFRAAVDRILTYPRGWQALDETYRRCRLHRFPYGIVYKIDGETIRIVAFGHLHREPYWQNR